MQRTVLGPVYTNSDGLTVELTAPLLGSSYERRNAPAHYTWSGLIVSEGEVVAIIAPAPASRLDGETLATTREEAMQVGHDALLYLRFAPNP